MAKALGDLVAAIFNTGPTPGAKPTRLISNADIPPRIKGGINLMNRMTKETLNQIIQNVENDPLAGMGSMSKRDLLIDRLLAHWNTVEARPVEQPTVAKPLISEPTKPAATSIARPNTGAVAAGPATAKVG